MHLDIKPDNIYLSAASGLPDGAVAGPGAVAGWATCRIGDFGLAVAREQNGSMVRCMVNNAVLPVHLATCVAAPQGILSHQGCQLSAGPLCGAAAGAAVLPIGLQLVLDVCRTGRRAMVTTWHRSCLLLAGSPPQLPTSSAWVQRFTSVPQARMPCALMWRPGWLACLA